MSGAYDVNWAKVPPLLRRFEALAIGCESRSWLTGQGINEKRAQREGRQRDERLKRAEQATWMAMEITSESLAGAQPEPTAANTDLQPISFSGFSTPNRPNS